MAQITLIEAVTQALAYEMAHDDSVMVLGEDVGLNGGVFRATQGLQEKFGELRVLDTPLDETTIAGVTVGLAVAGMKPVAEAQFEGFIYPMMEQIACHAAPASPCRRCSVRRGVAASAHRNITPKRTSTCSPTSLACVW